MKKILYTLLFLANFVYADLLKPENNAELNYIHVLFEWEQVYESESYNFQLSTDQTFNNIIVDTIDETTLYIHKTDIDWNSEYFWRVRPQFSDESFGDWINTYTFSTGLKRSDAYSIINNEEEYQDGVTIFSSFFNYYSAMIDKDGNEIWNTGNNNIVYYNLDYYGQLFGCYVNNDIENYLPGIEFSINNEIIWEEPNNDFLHHELIQLADGNYLGLVEVIENGPIPIGPWTPLYQALGFQADGVTNEFPWVGDKIVIWDKDTKNIIWEWNSYDYFSTQDYDTISDTWIQGFYNGRYDWTHANALFPKYNEQNELEHIYLSSRHLSRITKIDYNTKNIIWNMGIDMPSGDVNCGQDIGFSFQHSVTVTDEGNIMTLDNGNISQIILDTNYPTTRGLEIAVDENNNSCSTNVIWEYSLPEEYFGFASGNVQKLENNNYLIVTVGDGGTALEVDLNNNHIWEGKFNLQLPSGAVYRANRVSGLYPVAFSTMIENMYTDLGTNYIDNPENGIITLSLYNEGSSSEEYNIYLSINNGEWSGFMPSEGLFLNVNESNSYDLPISNANIVSVKIIPKNRQDLEKNITIYINGCTDPVDCLGVCGGNAVEDCLGECNGTAIVDCNGICNGNTIEDCSGVCDGGLTIDCEGVCGGNAELDICGICNGNSSLPCNECGDGYTLYNTIPNSTIILDGSSCFNDIDISSLNDIISINSISLESPIHLGTQNWINGRITRLEVGNYYQGGQVTLTTLPESISNMTQLSVLYANYNELTQLPNSITDLENLVFLVLSFNQVTNLPEQIGNLTNLYWLDMGYNQLESIPESIGSLENLVYLWIFNNNLSSLPSTFCNLNVNWNSDDYSFLPYFGSGGNQLCDNIPECIESSPNLNSSIDPLYYSFEITTEQECETLCVLMDLNLDGIINIVDIIATVNIIIGSIDANEEELCAGDINNDGTINIVDVISIVNFILD